MNNLGAIGRLSERYGVQDGIPQTNVAASRSNRAQYTTTSPNNNLLGGLAYAASLQASPQASSTVGYENSPSIQLRREANTTNAESRAMRPKEYWEAPVDKTRTAEFGRQTHVATQYGRGRTNCCQKYYGYICTLLWILAALAVLGGLILAYRGFFKTKSTQLSTQPTQVESAAQRRFDSEVRPALVSTNRASSALKSSQSNVQSSVATARGLQPGGIKTKSQKMQSRQGVYKSVNRNTYQNKTQLLGCSTGFFRYRGQCIKCPNHSTWNGTNCILPQRVSEVYPSRKQDATFTIQSILPILHPQQQDRFFSQTVRPAVKEVVSPTTNVIRHERQPN